MKKGTPKWSTGWGTDAWKNSTAGRLAEAGQRLGMFPAGAGRKEPMTVAMKAMALARDVYGVGVAAGVGRDLTQEEIEGLLRTAWALTPEDQEKEE
jgi:hypothetical protein